MPSENQNTPAASKDEEKPKVDEDFSSTIDENDPHKVEKLANAGKDVDAAEASE